MPPRIKLLIYTVVIFLIFQLIFLHNFGILNNKIINLQKTVTTLAQIVGKTKMKASENEHNLGDLDDEVILLNQRLRENGF